LRDCISETSNRSRRGNLDAQCSPAVTQPAAFTLARWIC